MRTPTIETEDLRTLRRMAQVALCLLILAPEAGADKADLLSTIELGALTYSENCTACHRLDGSGEERLYPSLHNQSLLADKHLLVQTVLNGRMSHQKNAKGKSQRLMPAWDFLTDKEVAAVIAYITKSWGAQMIVVSEEEVAEARAVLKQETPLP